MVTLNHKLIATHAKDNRWSAAAIAAKAGVHVNTVLGLFRGESVPTATNLKAICDVIGLPVEEVFIETERAAA